ncbi:addiction module component family protein [Lyngbya aestuarii BL J]|uniref:Addiction module component family protein n=1 Tax=Lyngbya aestuarii BL J TaxID=1348334 RepID=U7QN50_9CYAN|nr:hypothetical protein [Lyngbya aestuarii]ERT09318.1 addiction module component family protein [Lyngbya aestuarii BL J]
MNWQELRKEADNLPVYERLLLVEAIIRSLSNELRPKEPIPDEVWERLRGGLKTDEPSPTKGGLTELIGILKTDNPPPTDEEIEAILDERLEEKYLQ